MRLGVASKRSGGAGDDARALSVPLAALLLVAACAQTSGDPASVYVRDGTRLDCRHSYQAETYIFCDGALVDIENVTRVEPR